MTKGMLHMHQGQEVELARHSVVLSIIYSESPKQTQKEDSLSGMNSARETKP
jgi:hypothetical protein